MIQPPALPLPPSPVAPTAPGAGLGMPGDPEPCPPPGLGVGMPDGPEGGTPRGLAPHRREIPGRPQDAPTAPQDVLPGPGVPVQRRGPRPPGRPLVGGDVPVDVFARLSAGLQEIAGDGVGTSRLPRPGVTALLGGVVVLAVLLVVMTVLGLLL